MPLGSCCWKNFPESHNYIWYHAMLISCYRFQLLIKQVIELPCLRTKGWRVEPCWATTSFMDFDGTWCLGLVPLTPRDYDAPPNRKLRGINFRAWRWTHGVRSWLKMIQSMNSSLLAKWNRTTPQPRSTWNKGSHFLSKQLPFGYPGRVRWHLTSFKWNYLSIYIRLLHPSIVP